MIISSWNVNSVRARISNILDYLKSAKPDIILMQEIKTEEKNFPFNDFKKNLYDSHVLGQKSYNGVAIVSKVKIDNVNTNLILDELKQARIISGEISFKGRMVTLVNIYTPNGNPVGTDKYSYKIDWLNKLVVKLKNLLKKNENIILVIN